MKKDVDGETECLSLSINLLSQLGFELAFMTSTMSKCHSKTEKIPFGVILAGEHWIVLFVSKP